MIGTSFTAVRCYEDLLNEDRRWALDEGSRHFDKQNRVHRTLQKIAANLNELGISYAVAGGMALFEHGYRRFTEDVDLLVTRESLQVIHKHLDGLGYVRPFEWSKNLRDTKYGVRIKFLLAGEFPGDGKPKPVAFPDPSGANVELDGIAYLSLPRLIELKLASGMSSPHRLRDLADVQELIKVRSLPLEFSDQLNPYVRDKFAELWSFAQQARKEEEQQ